MNSTCSEETDNREGSIHLESDNSDTSSVFESASFSPRGVSHEAGNVNIFLYLATFIS